MNVDWLVHAAYVLYLFSYLVRDILWLRAITIVAALTLLPYFALQAEPLWAPVGWNVLFVAINVVQIYRLVLERRPVELSETEKTVYRLSFRVMTPRKFKKLIDLAVWRDIEPDHVLIEEETKIDDLFLLVEGKMSVKARGVDLATLERGKYLGEMSFLVGELTSATVRCLEKSKVVAWPRERLRALMNEDPDIGSALEMLFGADVVEKLRDYNLVPRLPTPLPSEVGGRK